MMFSSHRAVRAVLAATLAAPGALALTLLSEAEAPPAVARSTRPAPARTLAPAPEVELVPAPPPTSAAAALVEGGDPAALAAAIASSTWAALPPVEPPVLDEVELESRRKLADQLVEWLALEDHPAAALIEAEQVAEHAAWLSPASVERLLTMARADDLPARRRAAFVALGGQRPASAAHVAALLDAFRAAPHEEARAGLVQALLALRQGGATIDAALREVMEPRYGAPSPEVLALAAAR